METQAHAQLFIAPAHAAPLLVQNYLQKIFCNQQGCTECTACLLIEKRKHHNVLWITPETRYTLDLLDGLFKHVEFALEENEQFFFVLEKADFLTAACANSLLKIVEEPPAGYHFIFTAQRAQLVLPTIRSRCTLTSYGSDKEQTASCTFSSHFMTLQSNPHAFLKELSATQITEIESAQLVDTFLDYWCSHYKEALANGHNPKAEQSKKMITLFSKALETPAMPGSTKIFWKNLFLQKELVK